MTGFAEMIAAITARVDGAGGDALPRGRGGRRARGEYVSLIETFDLGAMFGACGLPSVIGSGESANVDQLVLLEMGVVMARIVREPHDKPRKVKSRFAWDDESEITDAAPRWRHALTGTPENPGEDGTPALILPVADACIADTLSCWRFADADFLDQVCDLIALPLDGGRPLSFTGHTLAVGHLQPDSQGRLVLYTSGKAWLDAHISRARAKASEWPAHLIETECMPFDAPETFGALLVEHRAFEWRVCRHDCSLPKEVSEILCPDSRKFAEHLDGLLRAKVRVRPIPTVRGPAKPAERAAA